MARPDPALAILPFCAILALSGVGLLVPRQSAQAAPPTTSAAKPAPVMDDDGDGDELLEHWGDPKYAHEERLQMAGGAAAFALLGTMAWRKWLAEKGTGGPDYENSTSGEHYRADSGRLDRRALLDRFTQHTSNCKACSQVTLHYVCAHD